MSDDHIISEIESSMGGPSHEVMALGSAYLAAPQKRSGILDLGCGDGRNAFMLSGSGMLVTAVDISSASIRRLQNLATHYSRDIEISVSNVANFKFERTYESILAHGILHFLDSHDIESLV